MSRYPKAGGQRFQSLHPTTALSVDRRKSGSLHLMMKVLPAQYLFMS